MHLRLTVIPSPLGPATPTPPEIGTSMSSSESWYYGQRAPAPNRAWLAIASRVVPASLNVQVQGDPLPILFI